MTGAEETWEPLDTAVTIETPEHVQFSHLVAGPARRAAAYAIDTTLRALVLAAVAIALRLGGVGAGHTMAGLGIGVLWLVAFVLEWAYFVLFETLWRGQSPGKRALGLRVVSASGRPLGFVDSVLRNVLRAADFLPVAYALGVAVTMLDGKFRRLGDLVGGTLVVAEERGGVEAPLPRLVTPTAAELAAVPSHVELLPREKEAVELLLRRRPRLGTARAEELAEVAASAVARRTGFRHPDPARFLEILYYRALGGPSDVA